MNGLESRFEFRVLSICKSSDNWKVYHISQMPTARCVVNKLGGRGGGGGYEGLYNEVHEVQV